MSATIRNTLIFSTLSLLASAQKLDAGCSDVVIFMARGNDAPYHDDRTTPFIDATCAKLQAQGTSCDYIDIQFDVTKGADYCAQVAEGERNGHSQVTAFNAKCPDSHIVINGYSEGAHVAGNVLGGPGGCTGTSTGIDPNSAAGKAIAAALLWGDVMHTANQPYNVLDGASKQKNPRPAADLARLNRYSSVLRSYCAAGDPVCANGNTVADHLNYFQLYTDEASSWVVAKINALKPKPSSSSTLSTSTRASSSGTGGSATATASATASATVTGGPSYGNGTAPGYPTEVPSDYPTETEGETVTSTPCETDSAPAPTGDAPAPTGDAPAPTSDAPAPTGGMSYPTDVPVFPAPVPYQPDSCVVVVEMKYVYA